MIQATAQREWFRVDQESAKAFLALQANGDPPSSIPGLTRDRRDATKFLVHRNMLALIDKAPELKPIDSNEWAVRDAWCAERGFKLRTTQQQAIDFITRRKGAVLADDMRLGKTLSALMCHKPECGRLVIVAPLSTRAVWLGWIKRVFPELADQVGVCVGKKFDRELMKRPIVFLHYEILACWQSDRPIHTLVLDETHALTNPDAERTKAAFLLASRADQVIPMTGTPIWKFPTNLWSILNLANMGAWGNWYDFAFRYGAPMSTSHGTKWAGVSNEQELHTRLSEVMLRRRWLDVVDGLPPITRSVVIAEVNEAERKRLDILAGKLASDRTNTAGNLAHYRRVVSQIKESCVNQEINKVVSRGEPVVVWTWHKEYAERFVNHWNQWKTEGREAFLITGDVSAPERERRIAEWRETKNGILVATLGVASVGVDFSHARIAIFAEIDYTPATIGQGEMRTFDAKRPMDVIFVIANHFIDQRIIRALIAKLGAADPLGVAAAIDAIDAMRDAILGPRVEGDLDRLLEDFIASAA